MDVGITRATVRNTSVTAHPLSSGEYDSTYISGAGGARVGTIMIES